MHITICVGVDWFEAKSAQPKYGHAKILVSHAKVWATILE